jgi:prophage antirepressor-like protein
VLTDVCRVLDIANPRDAAARLDPDEKDTVALTDGIRSGPGNPNMTIISESGLYTLTLTSRKPEAKPFKRWVTAEVLPTIRRSGAYGVQRDPMELLDDPNVLRGLLVKQLDRAAASEAQIAIMAPQVAALARLEAAEGAMCLTEAAKTLGVPPRALFSKLSKLGWIYRRQDDGPWVAYQAALDLGRLQHRAYTITRSDGREHVRHQVVLTAKGLTRLAELLGVELDASPVDGEVRLVTA